MAKRDLGRLAAAVAKHGVDHGGSRSAALVESDNGVLLTGKTGGQVGESKTVEALPKEVMALNGKITESDKLIEGRFANTTPEVIISMPGIGPTLGAELLPASAAAWMSSCGPAP